MKPLSGRAVICALLLSSLLLWISPLFAQECNDDIDNDRDGGIDAYQEINRNATRTFNSCGDVRSFVNSFPQFNKIPDGKHNLGCARSDALTRAKVCELAGFKRVADFVTGRWHSCHNNTSGYWEPAINNFKIENACKAGNKNLDFLVCADPVGECNDGKDNDGDGKIDFPNDPGCRTPYDDSEHVDDSDCDSPDDDSEAPQCSDRKDNDGDGKIDYPADPGCSGPRDDDESDDPECSDRIDNDGDGKIDYPNDPGCTGPNDDDETNLPQCNDKIDNDGDGLIDYPNDPGCDSKNDNDESDYVGRAYMIHPADGDVLQNGNVTFTWRPAKGAQKYHLWVNEEQPQGGFKRLFDVDELTDTRYPYPRTLPVGTYRVWVRGYTGNLDQRTGKRGEWSPPHTFSIISKRKPQCDDGIDNDKDGKIDFPADPGCDSKDDDDEYNKPPHKPQCNDGKDNDGDGLIDFPDDPGCDRREDDDETDHTKITECNDGIDNDGDGVTDYAGGDHTIAYRYGTRDPEVGESWEIWNVRRTNGGKTAGSYGPIDGDWPAWQISDTSHSARTIAYSTPVNSYYRTLIETASWELTAWVKVMGTHDDPLDGGQALVYDDGQRAYGMLFGSDENGDQIVSLAAAYNPKTGRYADNGLRYVVKGKGNSHHEYVLRYNPRTQEARLLVDGEIVIDIPRWIGYPSDGFGPDIWWGANSIKGKGTAHWSLSMFKLYSDQGDPGCTSNYDNSEADGTTECQDYIDNDGDGLTDSEDPQCELPMDNDEDFGVHQCRDDIDNDGDGLVDFNDPGCWGSMDNDETGDAPLCSGTCGSYTQSAGTRSGCGDFHDNDEDGLVDDLDPGCRFGSDEQDDELSDGCRESSIQIKDSLMNQFDALYQAALDQLNPYEQVKNALKLVKRSSRISQKFEAKLRSLPKIIFTCDERSQRADSARSGCPFRSTAGIKRSLSKLTNKIRRIVVKLANRTGNRSDAQEVRRAARYLKQEIKKSVPSAGKDCL